MKKTILAAICVLACNVSMATTYTFGPMPHKACPNVNGKEVACDYTFNASNSYKFTRKEDPSVELMLVMVSDEFGGYLVLARKSGGVWGAYTPYVRSFITDTDIRNAGSVYNYLASALADAAVLLESIMSPKCPADSSNLADRIGFDLASGDISYNKDTHRFEFTKNPPLSHVGCLK